MKYKAQKKGQEQERNRKKDRRKDRTKRRQEREKKRHKKKDYSQGEFVKQKREARTETKTGNAKQAQERYTPFGEDARIQKSEREKKK